KEVGIGDVLISMFTEEESHAVFFLRKQGIERLDIMNYVAHGIRKMVDDIEDDDLDDAIWDDLGDDTDQFNFDDFDDSDDSDDETSSSGRDANPENQTKRNPSSRKKSKRSALA